MGDYHKRYDNNRSWLRKTASGMKHIYFNRQSKSKKQEEKKKKFYNLEYFTERQKKVIQEEVNQENLRRKKVFWLSLLITLIIVIIVSVLIHRYDMRIQKTHETRLEQSTTLKKVEEGIKLMDFYEEHFELGAYYFSEGHLNTASREFERLRYEFPNDTSTLRMLTKVYNELCLKENRHCKKALLTVNTWIDVNPSSRDAQALKNEFLLKNPELVHLKNKKWKNQQH